MCKEPELKTALAEIALVGCIYFLLILKGQSGLAGVGEEFSFNMCYLGV